MKTKFFLTTVFLLCNFIIISQWSISKMQVGRSYIGCVSSGDRVYFAGGYPCDLNHTNIIEIYNTRKDKWEEAKYLCTNRICASGISIGSKIIFAGGVKDFYNGQYSDEVDIFDTLTMRQQVQFLSVPRAPVSIANNKKVLMAGGLMGGEYPDYIVSDVVDILDIESGEWTKEHLSQARMGMSVAIGGDLAFFAGGYTGSNHDVSDVIDIYNFKTGKWSVDNLSVARAFSTAATLGNKIYFAGGALTTTVSSDRVDIYNLDSGTWSATTLSTPRSFIFPRAPVICDQIFFGGDGNFEFYSITWNGNCIIDVYDGETDTWSVMEMKEQNMTFAIASANNKLVVAGGSPCRNSVEIYNCLTCPLEESGKTFEIEVFPNPVESIINIKIPKEKQLGKVSIYNTSGHKVFESNKSRQKINIEFLAQGVYIMLLQIDGIKYHKKLYKL